MNSHPAPQEEDMGLADRCETLLCASSAPVRTLSRNGPSLPSNGSQCGLQPTPRRTQTPNACTLRCQLSAVSATWQLVEGGRWAPDCGMEWSPATSRLFSADGPTGTPTGPEICGPLRCALPGRLGRGLPAGLPAGLPLGLSAGERAGERAGDRLADLRCTVDNTSALACTQAPVQAEAKHTMHSLRRPPQSPALPLHTQPRAQQACWRSCGGGWRGTSWPPWAT